MWLFVAGANKPKKTPSKNEVGKLSYKYVKLCHLYQLRVTAFLIGKKKD